MAKLIGAAAEFVRNADRIYSGILWRDNKVSDVPVYGKYKQNKIKKIKKEKENE